MGRTTKTFAVLFALLVAAPAFAKDDEMRARTFLVGRGTNGGHVESEMMGKLLILSAHDGD